VYVHTHWCVVRMRVNESLDMRVGRRLRCTLQLTQLLNRRSTRKETADADERPLRRLRSAAIHRGWDGDGRGGGAGYSPKWKTPRNWAS
jgi:hypothetical protein